MLKFTKRAAALLLCLAMILPIVACDSDVTVAPGKGNIADYGTVWSAPSTVKVAQKDAEYAPKGNAELIFNTVKNEYESHQLFITAKTDVGSYYLESVDLRSGDNILSKDNITVYMERYVTVADVYGTYIHPDALIPIDAALEAGELTIKGGDNAAFWITVHVPAETPAGVYEGTFKLSVENAAMDIPVRVTVNDYTLSDITNGRTLFSWRYDRVGAGELDSSVEMMETYYEFFLDYGISLQSLPLESQTHEEIVDALYKYYDILTSYTIQNKPGEVPGGGTVAEQTKEMIYAVASISSPEKNYFDKAMLYVVDEPKLEEASSRTYVLSMIGHINKMLQECVDTIAADTTGKYDSFKSIEGWENSILDIPNIMPMTATVGSFLLNNSENEEIKKIMAALNTICPTFDVFNDQEAEKLVALCKQNGIENIWWYGCVGPTAPYGNYHIGDKNLLGARTYSWVQAKFDIEGNLYWDAAAYTDENPMFYNQYVDIYEQPFRGTHAGFPAGDGCLAYPGAAYGIYGPLPSMRLMSIRDGMEELEMLLALEAQYEKLEGTYGEEFDAHDSITSIVDAVSYNGSKLYADGESGLNFDQLRASLIDSLVWNEMGIGFALAEIGVEGKTAHITYYVAENCKVTIDGEVQTPVSGCKYEYTMDLTQSTDLNMEIETAGKKLTVKRFISKPTIILQNFEDEAVLSDMIVSEGGAVALAETEGYTTTGRSAHVQVVGKITGDMLVDAGYVPTLTINTAALNEIENLSNVKYINLDVYNPGEPFKFTVKIYAGSNYVNAGSYTAENGKTTITMPVNSLNFSALAQADRMVFEFANSADGETANTYEFYMDNMTAAE